MKDLVSICAALFILVFSFSPASASSVLFSETFGDTILPETLRYAVDPDFGEWKVEDGRLIGRKTAAGGGELMYTISKRGFGLGNNTFTYSADIGRPLGTVPGGSGVGLVVGNYKFVFHPGYPKDTDGAQGAFRIEKGLFNSETVINNQDMGFIPALDKLHNFEVKVNRQKGKVTYDVSISGEDVDSQYHIFNYSYEGRQLGNGKVGIFIQGTNPPGTNGGFFDNLLLIKD